MGIALIVIGIVFLAAQVFRIDIGQIAWPFFIVVPGVTLILLALVIGDKAGEALVILGSIITSTGLLLLYQNAFGHWESWAYAWALVAPTSIGIGLFLFGAIHDRPERARDGLRMAGVGIVMFLIAGSFFELVLGFGGLGLGQVGWPVVLIGLGVVLLLSNLLGGRRNPTM
jgi:hypothetical protein